MVAIRCEGLSRRFDQVEALKPLDLEIPTGSIFGFLGRNGAGKTTAIRLFTGLARPTTGKAWVAGVETTNGSDLAKMKFGYLPEEPSFYSWMTSGEFLTFIGRLFGLHRAELQSRVVELLELADLTGTANRRIGGFSRGMRQRLGLAQALIHRPPILFLDEPTSALDPAGRKDVLDLLDKLRGETTVFLSSHILADVERVCDTIGIIHEGELLLVAGRDELLSRYAGNVLLLNFDPQCLPLSESFLRQLNDLDWTISVNLDGEIMRLTVGDEAKAKQEILPFLVENELVLTRYEWERPTLEDVFLSLSDS